MNKTLRIDNELDVTVKGVFEDIPANSELADLSFMAPWQLVYNSNEWLRTMPDPWRPNAFIVYVQLNPTADFHIVSQKIRDSKLKKVNSELAKKKPAVFLHPMSDWHLRSEFENGINKGGRIGYVWMFAAIGFFVLLLACINFMNLSTARSEKRAKEVGIRKAIGSMRMHLVTQFLGESAVMALFSSELEKLERKGLQPDEKMLAEMARVRAKYDGELEARFAGARGFVDAILSPEDTREAIELALRTALNNPGPHLGVPVLPYSTPSEIDR